MSGLVRVDVRPSASAAAEVIITLGIMLHLGAGRNRVISVCTIIGRQLGPAGREIGSA